MAGINVYEVLNNLQNSNMLAKQGIGDYAASREKASADLEASIQKQRQAELTIAEQEGKAALDAQTKTKKFAAAAGADDMLVKLGAQLAQSVSDANFYADKAIEGHRTSLFTDPLAFVQSIFTQPVYEQGAQDATSKAAIVSDSIGKIKTAVSDAAKVQELTAEKVTAATQEARLARISELANQELFKVRIENAKQGSADLKSLYEMDRASFHDFHAAESLRISEAHLGLAQQQLALQQRAQEQKLKEEKDPQLTKLRDLKITSETMKLEAEKTELEANQKYAAEINAGAAALGIKLEPITAESVRITKGMGNKEQLDRLNFMQQAGASVLAGQPPILGNTLTEVLTNRIQYLNDLDPNSPFDSKVMKIEGQAREIATAKLGKLSKDKNEAAMQVQAVVKEIANEHQKDLSQNTGNIYVAPPLSTIVKASQTADIGPLAGNPVWEKTLKPLSIAEGELSSSPDKIVGLLAAGIDAGEYTPTEAAESMALLYQWLVHFNNKSNMYRSNLLPEQSSYNWKEHIFDPGAAILGGVASHETILPKLWSTNTYDMTKSSDTLAYLYAKNPTLKIKQHGKAFIQSLTGGK